MSKNNKDHAINAWIRNNYGSKRGFLRTWKYKTIYQLGGFREYRNIDWDAIERLVFVSKGNICRSAYAEAVARSLDIKAVSCGVQKATFRSIVILDPGVYCVIFITVWHC